MKAKAIAAALFLAILSAQEETKYIRLDELKEKPVVLVDSASSGSGYKLGPQSFSTRKALFAFLEAQPAGFFAKGILLVDEEKAQTGDEILPALMHLARRRKFNLYLRQVTGKGGDDQRVEWVVRPSR